MIDINHLTFAYQNNIIFNDLSFKLDDYKIISLLGLNGEGKTTLIKLLLALLKPNKGKIIIDNNDINNLKEKDLSKLFSYVPQENDDSLIMSVLDFICLGGIGRQELFKGPSENDKLIANSILKDLKAEDLINKRLETLSHGQRRLIYLARAIFQDSKIMILDEPVNSLDFIKQHNFLSFLKDYSNTNNKRVIMSIHDPALAYQYSDTFIFFKDHQCYDVLNKNDISFNVKFNKDVSLLYEKNIEILNIDNNIYIKYKQK